MPYEAIRSMPYDELVTQWLTFAAHCERRAAAEKAAVAAAKHGR